MMLRIRDDIPTTPIETKVKSAGIAEEDQIFKTGNVEETEEPLW